MPIYSAHKPYLEFDLVESDNGILTEALVYKFVPKKEVDEDFKKFAADFAETAQKMAKTKIGYGLVSPSFGIKFKDVKSKIEKGKVNNLYVLSVGLKGILNGLDIEPTLRNRLTASVNVIFDFLDKVCKSQGMKKISSKPGAWSSYIKEKKDCIYIVDWAAVDGNVTIYIRCLLDTPDNREIAAGGKAFVESNVLGENTSSNDDIINHSKEETTPNTVGFAGLSPEELYGFDPELGLVRSEGLANNDEYKEFFKDPKVMKTFTEYFDLTDSLTRKAVVAMNEADQNSVLTALTSKLYDNIVSKVDDIDYGEIPATKGDITKLSNYNRLVECVELLKNILKEFKQDTKPIDEIEVAIANISTHKDTFMKAYKFDCELPIIMYNNAVLSIISAVSYMIATSIEFMKTPNQDNFQITLDKVSYAKTKSNMVYSNLKRFNKCVKSGEFDKAMNHVLQNRVKGLGEAAAIGTFAAIGGVIGLIAIIANIIPILREMVFFFYYTRMRVSDFFDIQADLLQMNAYNVENDPNKDEEQKERIISKQLKIVELFRKIANKIAFTGKKAEVETTKEIASSAKKMKLDDVSDELPDSVSALF